MGGPLCRLRGEAVKVGHLGCEGSAHGEPTDR